MTETGQAAEARPFLQHLVGFSRLLHYNGIPVNSSNLINLLKSIELIDLGRREDFYAAARVNLVSNARDIETFDNCFRYYWEKEDSLEEELSVEVDPSEDGEESQQRDRSLSTEQDADDQGENKDSSSPASYSPNEQLMRKDLGMMTEREIEEARKMIAPLVAMFADHQSRRYEKARRGRMLDFRQMLRSNAILGQDGVKLRYRKKRIKKHRLMLLCDVSGSMQTYSSFIIHFIYALNRELSDFEVAVFSTRMTPITQYLKSISVEESLALVADYVHDWAGGTTIGSSIKEFNEKYARQMLRSKTTVIVLSDGWDRGDAEQLKTEMKRLSQRSHKLIWLNPLLGNPVYKPLCQGIKTALPFMDYFLPAHSLESLVEVARTLKHVQS